MACKKVLCCGGFQVLWEDVLLTIFISMENSKTQQQLVTGKDQCLQRPVVYSPPLKSQQRYLPWWLVPLLVLVGRHIMILEEVSQNMLIHTLHRKYDSLHNI